MNDEKGVQCILLQYNIDAARREQQDSKPESERIPRLFFQNRVCGIVDTIKSSCANIATLQQLRNLESSPVKINHFIDMVTRECNLTPIGPFYYSKEAISLALCTFYDRELFYVQQVNLIHLHKIPDKLCLCVLFECIKNGTKFIIANTHFDLPEEKKWEEVTTLFPALLSMSENLNAPLIVNGDFNLFDDLEGKSQRLFIKEKYNCIDIYERLYLARDSNILLSGTFRGFPEVDKFHQPYEKMSKLDHGFLIHGDKARMTMRFSEGHSYSVNLTEENVKSGNLPSDHLPCVCEFILLENK